MKYRQINDLIPMIKFKGTVFMKKIKLSKLMQLNEKKKKNRHNVTMIDRLNTVLEKANIGCDILRA